MSRIISLELNKKLRKEYRLRFFSLLFFMISIVSLANIAMMISSYVLLSLYENIYTNEKNSESKKVEVLKDNENLDLKISQVYALSQKIPLKVNLIDTNIAKDVLDYAGQNISINSIEILPGQDSSKVTIRGLASTRDSLLHFQEVIKNDLSIKDFVIPIETMTKQKDIVFNVTFTHHEN